MKLRYQAIGTLFVVASFLLGGWFYFSLPLQYLQDNYEIPDKICEPSCGKTDDGFTILFRCEWVNDTTLVCQDYDEICCENLAK